MSQPDSVIEQLTYFMFARQLDEAEADIESAEILGDTVDPIFGSSNEEQMLRWRNFIRMKADELHEHFEKRVFPFMKQLNTDKKSAFSRYLSGATFKINEPLALKKVVQGLEELFQNDIKGLDMQGDLYEHMLGKLNAAGRLGAFRTPKQIRDMMVALMAPTPDMRICDPACGTAGFLISAAEYIRGHYEKSMTKEQWDAWDSKVFTGYDTDETMCRLSCMNLMLHSVKNPTLQKQDSVSKDFEDHDIYDLCLANPPFKGTINEENVSGSLSMVTNTKKTELLFVALLIRLLHVGGRCACIVPDGVLFGSSKAHKSLRKELVDNQYLEAVISMPSGVFKPYAGVSTAVLIFTKTNAGGTDKVWFYDMEADGFSLDDKRNPVDENDIPDIIERFHNRDKEESRERTEKSFFVPAQEIIDNDYDLSINKYKKTEYVPVEYPPTSEIIKSIEELNEKVDRETAELKKLLNINLRFVGMIDGI